MKVGKFTTFSLHDSTLSARRLEWLHCFSRNERWKEEVLLTIEELRRLGETHRYWLNQAKKNATDSVQYKTNWIDRGYLGMLQWQVKILEIDYNSLPTMAKDIFTAIKDHQNLFS